MKKLLFYALCLLPLATQAQAPKNITQKQSDQIREEAARWAASELPAYFNAVGSKSNYSAAEKDELVKKRAGDYFDGGDKAGESVKVERDFDYAKPEKYKVEPLAVYLDGIRTRYSSYKVTFDDAEAGPVFFGEPSPDGKKTIKVVVTVNRFFEAVEMNQALKKKSGTLPRDIHIKITDCCDKLSFKATSIAYHDAGINEKTALLAVPIREALQPKKEIVIAGFDKEQKFGADDFLPLAWEGKNIGGTVAVELHNDLNVKAILSDSEPASGIMEVKAGLFLAPGRKYWLQIRSNEQPDIVSTLSAPFYLAPAKEKEAEKPAALAAFISKPNKKSYKLGSKMLIEWKGPSGLGYAGDGTSEPPISNIKLLQGGYFKENLFSNYNSSLGKVEWKISKWDESLVGEDFSIVLDYGIEYQPVESSKFAIKKPGKAGKILKISGLGAVLAGGSYLLYKVLSGTDLPVPPDFR